MDFRPIEDDDIKFVWAAYKSGRLASMGKDFEDGKMAPAQFRERFQAEILANYAGAWTMFSITPKGKMPVGLILGFWSHPEPRLSPFMIVGDIIWFSWATARIKIESAVNFFDRVRKTIAFMEYAQSKDQKFFDVLCQHGIMRRVGTSYNVYPGESVAVYETRRA